MGEYWRREKPEEVCQAFHELMKDEKGHSVFYSIKEKNPDERHVIDIIEKNLKEIEERIKIACTYLFLPKSTIIKVVIPGNHLYPATSVARRPYGNDNVTISIPKGGYKN